MCLSAFALFISIPKLKAHLKAVINTTIVAYSTTVLLMKYNALVFFAISCIYLLKTIQEEYQDDKALITIQQQNLYSDLN